jgi:hypothetical protein
MTNNKFWGRERQLGVKGHQGAPRRGWAPHPAIPLKQKHYEVVQGIWYNVSETPEGAKWLEHREK